ncbi:MAG: hypothetical protein SFU25_06270 [Candidatus Caenarcaniphilales bacterium]|nr:hypothetical protein [Candidatus Caenarcaniphilales bacterium]
MGIPFALIGTGASLIATNLGINHFLPIPNPIQSIKDSWELIRERSFNNGNTLAARNAGQARIDFDANGNPEIYTGTGGKNGEEELIARQSQQENIKVQNQWSVQRENIKENLATIGITGGIFAGLTLFSKILPPGMRLIPAGLSILAAPIVRAGIYAQGDLKTVALINEMKKEISNPMNPSGLTNSPLTAVVSSAMRNMGMNDSEMATYILNTPTDQIIEDLKGNGGFEARNVFLAKGIAALDAYKVWEGTPLLGYLASLAGVGKNVLSSFIVNPNQSQIATA